MNIELVFRMEKYNLMIFNVYFIGILATQKRSYCCYIRSITFVTVTFFLYVEEVAGVQCIKDFENLMVFAPCKIESLLAF